MTDTETNVDQEENEKEAKAWPQILAVFIAALTSLNSSILLNWTSPSIPVLISDPNLGIDINLASYLTVIPPILTIITAPIYGVCLDRVGRKWCLISAGIMHICSWICVIFANSLSIYYLSRIFFGISDAAMFGVLPIYIGEVTTPKVRGRWGNFMGFFMYFGQLVMNFVGHFFNMKVSAYILICIPIAFVIAFMFMPDTPYYYLKKNQPEKAEESLRILRRSKNVDKEFAQMTADVKRQLTETGGIMDCLKIKSNRNAILIVGMGRGMQQLSGITAFAVYNQHIFQESGSSMDKGHSSMLYAGTLSLINFVALMFTDKLGRKKPMIISCTGCFIFLAAESVYFYLKDYIGMDLSEISWFPVLGLVGYIASFSSGLGLVPILLLSECFSTTIRAKASTIMTIIFGVYLVVINKLFQVLNAEYGLFAPFAWFTVCTFISIFLSYLYIPETKGKTLEEIQQMLKGNKNVVI